MPSQVKTTKGLSGLMSTSGNEEKIGEPLGTECPLSVALGSRSLPSRPTDKDIPVRVVARPRGRLGF